MAVTSGVFNKGLYMIATGQIAPASDTLKVALMPSTYTPNIDTQHYYSDISADECPASGNYTAGGVALGTKTVTEDDTGDCATVDAANPSWAALTQADVRIAVLYKDTGVAGTSPLLMYWDFGATQSPAAETFEIPIPSTGLYDIKKG